MSEQLADLMKRAGEAHARKQQKERNQKFFAWFEDTFGIEKYDKEDADGKPAVLVDSCMVFICKSFEEMSAIVHIKCNVCKDTLHSVGTVRNLEELGERLNLDEQGNYPTECVKQFSRAPYTPVDSVFQSYVEATN